MADQPQQRPGGRAERPQYGEGVDAIRQAAVAIATERGLAALTLRTVAERAGVSHALVRYHFGTRDRLVSTAVEEAVGRTLYLSAESTEPLSQRIDGTTEELRIQYQAMLAGDWPESIEHAYDRYRDEVTSWLAAHSLPPRPEFVLLLVAALDGLALQRLTQGPGVDVDPAIALLLDLLQSSASASAPPTGGSDSD